MYIHNLRLANVLYVPTSASLHPAMDKFSCYVVNFCQCLALIMD